MTNYEHNLMKALVAIVKNNGIQSDILSEAESLLLDKEYTDNQSFIEEIRQDNLHPMIG